MATAHDIDLSNLQANYPLANTEACKMLAKALEKAQDEKGWSQRQVAKMLNYRTSVTLSHMAIGRVPIPIDRTLDFARLLKMDPAEFLLAVIDQRHPELDARRVLTAYAKVNGGKLSAPKADSVLQEELESIAGLPLDELPVSVINILREAVADKQSSRRWMRIGEVPIVERLRRSRPDGLSLVDTKKLADFIDAL